MDKQIKELNKKIENNNNRLISIDEAKKIKIEILNYKLQKLKIFSYSYT